MKEMILKEKFSLERRSIYMIRGALNYGSMEIFKLENLGEENHESPVLTALHPTGLDVKAGNWVIRCLVLDWGFEFRT